MQKRQFLSRLVLPFAFISIIFSGSLNGQPNKELADLYENQQLFTLKEYLNGNRISDPNWKMFVSALFEQNADSAVKIYAYLYRTTEDKTLRKYIVERVSDYFYSRGYYKTAEKLMKDKKFLGEVISNQQHSKATGGGYGIQVGAFSSYSNALSQKNKFLKKVKDVTIVNKDSDGENLYVVVIGKYSSKEEAERELQTLDKKGIKGFVIQY